MLLGVPVWATEQVIHTAILTIIAVVFAKGFDLVFGYSGQLSLAQGAFMGVGAYSSSLLTLKLGLPFSAALLLSVVAAIAISLVVGIPSIQVTGHYLILVTLSFSVIFHQVLLNWVELTNGPMGLTNIPAPAVPASVFGTDDRRSFYWLAASTMIVVLLCSRRIETSTLGRSFIALRDDEIAAAAAGMNVRALKLIALGLSAAFAGVSGVLFAHYMRVIEPSSFEVYVSIEAVLMVIIGGRGTFWGPVVGALIVTALPEMLRDFAIYRMPLYGALVVGIVIFCPAGIVGTLQQVGRRAARVAPGRADAAAQGAAARTPFTSES
ncbi:MAG: branched-chain amino acid ABC transporter permease [Candidatus Rokubacteria bacterium]|nr:branched-chain amino acid ABC transporter permease [Candidatus Rokubacteria bacterium]